MPARKRSAPETIDLTQSPAGPTPSSSFNASESRKQQRSSTGLPTPAPSQSFHDDELEERGDEMVIGSTQDYNDATYRVQLYGVLDSKVVGIRYYRGYANPGEMVLARREPQNQYDSNAIRVDNVKGEQIGHIPRTVAAKLAKYMDSGSLRVEAKLNGFPGSFDIPVKISLLGSCDPVEQSNLITQMTADRLPVNVIKGYQRDAAKVEKERQKQLKQLQKEAKKKGGAVVGGNGAQFEPPPGMYVGGGSAGLGDGPDLEAFMDNSQRFNPRNLEQMTEDLGKKEQDLEKLPKAEQPEALASELLPFQLQGLHWLLAKESPQAPRSHTDPPVQLWSKRNNGNIYTNLATSFSLKDAPPVLASGGILADDMGLGKTVQMISLITADLAARKSCDQACGASLVIAPLGVMSNWSSQIERHVKGEHALRVLTYHGGKKIKIDSEEIKKYDVVITTYGLVSSEYWAKKQVPAKDGLFSVNWRRIIVDEGHNLRNPNAKKTVAALNLMAESRWILTGTPIVNSLKDLYTLVKFIRLTGGLERYELFNAAIIRPVTQGDEGASRLLQLLMQDVCLRRRKDMKFIDLKLPELSEYVHKIAFLDHEKEKYDALEAEAKGTLADYKATNGGESATKAYRHLLEILIRMRQLCNHWKMCGEGRFKDIMALLEENKVLDLTPENLEALQTMLQLSIDAHDDCPICLDNLKEPVITCCAHIFCHSCVEKVIETQQRCPMCRADLPSADALVRPAKEASAVSLPDINIDESSSKVEALISILRASQKKSGNKTIVFSQWTSFLDIIQVQLDKHGFRYCRIDGSMASHQRDAAMDALENDAECTVMLASLGVCSVGLNLVAANQVIMADTWWAPAIEDQAVDRVHRLGQKKPTTVFRLVMENSIEEGVLQIQSDKRKLMMLAFSEKQGKRDVGGKNARLADIEQLLR